MTFKNLLLLLLLITIFACDKTDSDTLRDDDDLTDTDPLNEDDEIDLLAVPADPNFDETKVNFLNLSVGQQNTYIGYQSGCELSTTPVSTDTLFLKVINQNQNIFTLEERVTVFSSTYTPDFPTSEYTVIFEEDYILIPTRINSRLFNFYGNDTLFLTPTDPVEMTQTECTIEYNSNVFTGDEIGVVPDFELQNEVIGNKIVVSCVPSITEIEIENGYLIYTPNTLAASYRTVEFPLGFAKQIWVESDL